MPYQIKIVPIEIPVLKKQSDVLDKFIFYAVEQEMRYTIKEMVRLELKKSADNWQRKPVFRGTFNKAQWTLTIQPTGPNKEKWFWVSYGTKPHAFGPKRQRHLVFPKNYTPSTSPDIPGQWGKTHRRYGTTIRTNWVRNPGIKARNFEDFVVEKMEPKIQTLIELAIRKALKDVIG